MCNIFSVKMWFTEEWRGLAKSMVAKMHRGLLCSGCGRQQPRDVKEGQFAVYAVDSEGELHRFFIVCLGCLKHLEFVRLLDMAADEFGLEQEGALLVPCQPRELQRILKDHAKN